MSKSNDDDEVSPGGSKMLRHGPAPAGWIPPAPSTGGDEIGRHMEKHYGASTWVFHEVISSLIHVDVHIVPPRPERNVWTLFTTGMSDLPMSAPAGFEDYRFAELILVLPPDWKVDELRTTPPPVDQAQWYWPIRWMKFLARFPHEHKTWLAAGHTLPNGDPPKPFDPGTKLCAWLLLPAISLPADARQIALADGRTVHFYVMHALHLEELSLKLNKGTDAVLDAFGNADKSEALVVDRPSTTRKKLFGLF